MIVPYPHQARIVIFDGLVTETRHERAAGTVVTKHHPPLRTYFLDLIDEDGGKLAVWDGLSYAAAIAAAEDWRRDGVLVDDRVSDVGGSA